MTHRMNQQRAALRPTKNMAFFYDDDSIADNISTLSEDYTTYDDSSITTRSIERSVDTHARADTRALADFLASTSPEDFTKSSLGKPQQRRTSSILNRFRKRSTATHLNGNASVSTKGNRSARHVPLPTYHSPSLRDSGVYSVSSSDKDGQYTPPPLPVPSTTVTADAAQNKYSLPSELPSSLQMPPPVIPAKSSARPKRPNPLPEAVALAAIAAASQQYADLRHLRSVPAAALNRRSIVRARHVQQEDGSSNKVSVPTAQVGPNSCPHCHQRMTTPQQAQRRRLSCPPVMASGDLVIMMDQDKSLRKKIMLLEAQLEEERNSRIKLEKAMRQQKSVARKIEQVEEERTRWKNNCQWMEDHLTLLPQ